MINGRSILTLCNVMGLWRQTNKNHNKQTTSEHILSLAEGSALKVKLLQNQVAPSISAEATPASMHALCTRSHCFLARNFVEGTKINSHAVLTKNILSLTECYSSQSNWYKIRSPPPYQQRTSLLPSMLCARDRIAFWQWACGGKPKKNSLGPDVGKYCNIPRNCWSSAQMSPNSIYIPTSSCWYITYKPYRTSVV